MNNKLLNEIWRNPTRVLKRVNLGSARKSQSDLYSKTNRLDPTQLVGERTPMTKPRKDIQPLFCTCPNKTSNTGTRNHKRETTNGEEFFVCQNCGSRKQKQKGQLHRESFEKALDTVLFNEETDKPVEQKPEGRETKSAEGAHRQDKGTTYIQQQKDSKFLLKADINKLKA